jgi:hypothetical protein
MPVGCDPYYLYMKIQYIGYQHLKQNVAYVAYLVYF